MNYSEIENVTILEDMTGGRRSKGTLLDHRFFSHLMPLSDAVSALLLSLCGYINYP